MAHECPDCGYTCHCNGDIDDLCLSIESDVNRCHHCVTDLDEDEEDYGDEYL